MTLGFVNTVYSEAFGLGRNEVRRSVSAAKTCAIPDATAQPVELLLACRANDPLPTHGEVPTGH